MSTVITKASTVLCGKSVPNGHGGKVQVSTTAKLKVKGNNVLLQASVANQTVVAGTCANPVSQSTKKCTTVTGVTSGVAKKLKVGGNGVLTVDLAGATDGNPVGSLAATAEHTKLTAI